MRRSLVRLLGLALLVGCGGDQPAGEIEGARLPDAALAQEHTAQQAARREIDRRAGGLRPAVGKRILFGDLHVHTTYSIDAFLMALPVMAGEGAHPPADACDFARYCSQLDFFSLNDHAEALTPAHWRETKESLRECNARAGDPSDPDLVAFVGFEWTQVGLTPETHYGHKNVIYPGLAEEELPKRPITALPDDGNLRALPGDRPDRARALDRPARLARLLGLPVARDASSPGLRTARSASTRASSRRTAARTPTRRRCCSRSSRSRASRRS